MRCGVCGGSRFVSTEYNTGDNKLAPALECTVCRTLILEELVARNEGERDSVRLAISLRGAARASIAPAAKSDTFAVGVPPEGAAQVQKAERAGK